MWSFSSPLRVAALEGLLALLMGRRGLEVAFDSTVGGAQAFPCFSGKALRCRWSCICRAGLGRGQLGEAVAQVTHRAPDLLPVA